MIPLINNDQDLDTVVKVITDGNFVSKSVSRLKGLGVNASAGQINKVIKNYVSGVAETTIATGQILWIFDAVAKLCRSDVDYRIALNLASSYLSSDGLIGSFLSETDPSDADANEKRKFINEQGAILVIGTCLYLLENTHKKGKVNYFSLYLSLIREIGPPEDQKKLSVFTASRDSIIMDRNTTSQYSLALGPNQASPEFAKGISQIIGQKLFSNEDVVRNHLVVGTMGWLGSVLALVLWNQRNARVLSSYKRVVSIGTLDSTNPWESLTKNAWAISAFALQPGLLTLNSRSQLSDYPIYQQLNDIQGFSETYGIFDVGTYLRKGPPGGVKFFPLGSDYETIPKIVKLLEHNVTNIVESEGFVIPENFTSVFKTMLLSLDVVEEANFSKSRDKSKQSQTRRESGSIPTFLNFNNIFL